MGVPWVYWMGACSMGARDGCTGAVVLVRGAQCTMWLYWGCGSMGGRAMIVELSSGVVVWVCHDGCTRC